MQLIYCDSANNFNPKAIPAQLIYRGSAYKPSSAIASSPISIMAQFRGVPYSLPAAQPSQSLHHRLKFRGIPYDAA